jgi:hypothetical protein
MTLTKKTTHIEEAKANLIEQFKNKPNLAALSDAYVEQIQDLEDVYFQLIDDRTLDTAVGVQLDGIGQIVGEERKGLNDDDYRIRLKARIRINLSSGTAEELYRILELLVQNNIEIEEFYPAAIVIRLDNEFIGDEDEIAGIIAVSRAAGVDATLEFTESPDANTFFFSNSDANEPSTTQGFSYHTDPWAPSTAYALREVVTNDDAGTDRDYICVTAGTSAGSGGPTGTGTGITDGTVTWDYLVDNTDPLSIGGVFAGVVEA